MLAHLLSALTVRDSLGYGNEPLRAHPSGAEAAAAQLWTLIPTLVSDRSAAVCMCVHFSSHPTQGASAAMGGLWVGIEQIPRGPVYPTCCHKARRVTGSSFGLVCWYCFVSLCFDLRSCLVPLSLQNESFQSQVLSSSPSDPFEWP